MTEQDSAPPSVPPTKANRSAPQPAELDPRLLVQGAGIGGYLTVLRRRITGGELGSLPVIIGLVVIWAIFQTQNSNFLTPGNITNLMLQLAATGTISVGIVLILLLGEIDLSVGSVSGLCASIMVVLNVKHGYGAVTAVLLALLAGAAIGAFHGFVFTRFGVPAFVVTLAGLIGWQGAQLQVLGKEGTINLQYGKGISKLTSTFFSPAVGWGLVIVVAVGYTLVQLNEYRARTRAGLLPRPMVEIIVRSAVVSAALLAAVAVLNQDRGLPLALLIFFTLVVLFDLMIKRTRYGRHILAVGGNIEAARRAGISVSGIRLSVFIIASTMAAAGGVLAASRLIAVNQSSGSGDVLLNAIAAAVIGGTSLFGGRGSAYSALLGMLVIQSISNGMDLLGKSTPVKFMITGAVLLAAVILDSLSRRGRQSSGRA